MKTTNKYFSWLFFGPAVIHLWWAWCVFRSPVELRTTGLADIYDLCSRSIPAVAAVLVLVSLLALLSLHCHSSRILLSFICILPQQFLMTISASTAWTCMRGSHFADGALYDFYFIAADQCYIFVIGLMHTCLIVDTYIFRGLRLWLTRE